MQDISIELQEEFDREGLNLTTNIMDVYEVYASDYVPALTGFNPSDALERFCSLSENEDGNGVVWNNLLYRCEFKSRNSASRYIDSRFNSVTANFSNVSRYIASFCLSNDTSGMWFVARRISFRINDNGIVFFVGRLQQADDGQYEKLSIVARQPFASISYEVPYRQFTIDDPDGLPSTDPNYKGFKFVNETGATLYDERYQTSGLFGFFRRWKTRILNGSYSSFSKTPLGKPIPFVLGMAQLQGIPIIWADIGQAVKFLMALCEGKVSAITGLIQRTQGFSNFINTTLHLGEPGGIGTQTADPQFPDAGLFAFTAFFGSAVQGSKPDVVDTAPETSAVVLCEVPLPDENGQYTLKGPSSSPLHLSRAYITSNTNGLNQPVELMDDEAFIKEAEFCAQPIVDDSQSETIILPASAQSHLAAGVLRRYRTTGLIDHRNFNYYLDGGTRPELIDPVIDFIDDVENPTAIALRTVLRQRYTLNLAVIEKVRATDVLFKTIAQSARLSFLTSANGRIKPLVEKPADSSLTRSATAIGATSIAIEDVETWKTSKKGKALIGTHTLHSEVRRVSTVRYSLLSNTLSIVSVGTGATVLTASGATFSGGTEEIAASATVQLSGNVQTGSQLKITIAGIEISYIQTETDTLGSSAGMLTAHVNANFELRRFIRAAWSVDEPNTVKLYSKLGFIDFLIPLEEAHTIGEEVIRVTASYSDEISVNADVYRPNIRKDTFRWSLQSKDGEYNQVKGTYRDRRNDFAEQPIEKNNRLNQNKTRQTKTKELDLSGVDNRGQAQRLIETEYAKLKSTGMTVAFGMGFAGTVHEESDVICVSHKSGGFRNLPVRIEEMQFPERKGPDVTARKYATAIFIDEVSPQEIPIPSTLIRDIDVSSIPQTVAVISAEGNVSFRWLRPATNFRTIDYYILTVGRTFIGGVVGDIVAGLNEIRVDGTNFTFPLPSSDGQFFYALRAHNSYGLGVIKNGSFVTQSSASSSLDIAVPTITKAPVVTKVEGSNEWNVLLFVPEFNAFTLTNYEVRVRRQSDNLFIYSKVIGREEQTRIEQSAFRCVIDYRARNQYRTFDNEGNVIIDGWSDWSSTAIAYEAGGVLVNPPVREVVIPSTEVDEGDGFNYRRREVLPLI